MSHYDAIILGQARMKINTPMVIEGQTKPTINLHFLRRICEFVSDVYKPDGTIDDRKNIVMAFYSNGAEAPREIIAIPKASSTIQILIFEKDLGQGSKQLTYEYTPNDVLHAFESLIGMFDIRENSQKPYLDHQKLVRLLIVYYNLAVRVSETLSGPSSLNYTVEERGRGGRILKKTKKINMPRYQESLSAYSTARASVYKTGRVDLPTILRYKFLMELCNSLNANEAKTRELIEKVAQKLSDRLGKIAILLPNQQKPRSLDVIYKDAVLRMSETMRSARASSCKVDIGLYTFMFDTFVYRQEDVAAVAELCREGGITASSNVVEFLLGESGMTIGDLSNISRKSGYSTIQCPIGILNYELKKFNTNGTIMGPATGDFNPTRLENDGSYIVRSKRTGEEIKVKPNLIYLDTGSRMNVPQSADTKQRREERKARRQRSSALLALKGIFTRARLDRGRIGLIAFDQVGVAFELISGIEHEKKTAPESYRTKLADILDRLTAERAARRAERAATAAATVPNNLPPVLPEPTETMQQ